MVTATQSPLIGLLCSLSEKWTEAHSAPPTRIGRVIVNDGGIVARLAQPGASTTTATLEKFARFLADQANWPDGAVPVEAVEFAHRVGVTPAQGSASPGNNADNSRAQHSSAA